MSKADHTPVLPPGIHKLTLEELRSVLVDPFPHDTQRTELYRRLEHWISKLRDLKTGAILWIDGSFVTRKFGPNDIDCVMWDPHFVADVSDTERSQVRWLVSRPTARSLYGLDLYLESPMPAERLHRQAYWRGLFGFQHSGTAAKGFVELAL